MKKLPIQKRGLKIKPSLIILLALIVVLCIYYLSLSSIDGNNLSIVAGDSGANAILIKKAKSLELFHGNYSRVGFFHPGPFFFQVQALAELLFANRLNWIEDIYLAQSSGIVILNIFLLSVIIYIISISTNSLRRGIWISLVSIVLISLKHPQVLSGMWMPQIYIMPYFSFITAFVAILVARIKTNKQYLANVGILTAIVSGFILIHGHASFVGLVPIQTFISIFIIEGLALEDITRFKKSPIDLIKTSAKEGLSFYRKSFSNKPFSIACIAIASIFIAPFLLETLYRYPGQFPSYFSFAEDSDSNSFTNSLLFLTNGWIGGPISALITVPGAIIISQKLRNTLSISLNSKILVVILVPAFLTTLFYAIKGIDNLKEEYIIYYFTAVSGLYLSWIISLSIVSLNSTKNNTKYLVLVFASILFAVIGVNTVKLNPYIHREAAVSKLYSYIQNGDVLSSINERSNSGWIHFNGIIAQNEIELDSKVFCIADDSWFISFTEKYKCENIDKKNREVNFFNKAEYNGVNITLKDQKKISENISIGRSLLALTFSKNDISELPHTTIEALKAEEEIDAGKYLFFGNYFKIKSGDYVAKLSYSCENANSCGKFEFVSNKGKNTIFTVPIHENSQGEIIKLFNTNSNHNLLGELRVKYEEGELEIHDFAILNLNNK